jgi:hypothetical protein
VKTRALVPAAVSILALFSVAGCSADSADPATSDEELRAKKTLLCASSANESVYYGRESQILLEANVSRDGVLANASLSMPGNNLLGVGNETWNAQKRYQPTNARYKGMQKYSSADAWCGYSVIAPPDLNGQTGKFSVYLQQACEGGFISTATLSCKVESKKPIEPDAPSAAAAIELRFTAAGKTAATEAGYYEASAFTGNKIVVASTDNSIDIEYLNPDDSESAPDDKLCYTGDTTKAKKIIWTMLGNTDGNGDHWLDEGATVTGSSGKTINVAWSVTGEGGSTPRSLSVPVCP